MTEPRWLTVAEMAAWEDFLAVTHRFFRRVEQQLKEDAGLSHQQYEVLSRLSAAGGELRMTELAGAALTSKSGLSYQVSQLERAGLVTRSSCQVDDRGVIATLTEAGWAKVRASAPGHVELVRELFVDSMPQPQFEGFAEALVAMRRRLDDHH